MLMNLFNSLGHAPGGPAAGAPGMDSIGENLVYSRAEIEETVLELQQGQMPVMLLCAGETFPLRSVILHVDRERGYFLLQQLWNGRDHALILEQDFFNLCGQVNGCTVLMSIRLEGIETHEGALCYRIPMPQWILGSQPRDPIRMRLRPTQPTALSFVTGDHVQATGWICNLSEGGVGFHVDEDEGRAIRPGQTLVPVSIQIGREEFSGLSLEVKHISRTDAGRYLVGATLARLPETLRQTLRRYLLMLQRDSARLA
jgi:c-di-GMP-binding flagellar brake protein YcgR